MNRFFLIAFGIFFSASGYAATTPAQAGQLARECKAYEYIFTGSAEMSIEARLQVINILEQSIIFEVTRTDNPNRRFMMMIFKIKPQAGLKLRNIEEGLREILLVPNAVLSCNNTSDLPQIF